MTSEGKSVYSCFRLPHGQAVWGGSRRRDCPWRHLWCCTCTWQFHSLRIHSEAQVCVSLSARTSKLKHVAQSSPDYCAFAHHTISLKYEDEQTVKQRASLRRRDFSFSPFCPLLLRYNLFCISYKILSAISKLQLDFGNSPVLTWEKGEGYRN